MLGFRVRVWGLIRFRVYGSGFRAFRVLSSVKYSAICWF